LTSHVAGRAGECSRRTLLGAAFSLAAAPGLGGIEARQSLDVEVHFAPQRVTLGGVLQLVYELHLTNFAPEPLRVLRLEVVQDGALGDRTIALADAELRRRAVSVGPRSGDAVALQPGEAWVVYMEVAVEQKSVRAVGHRIWLAGRSGAPFLILAPMVPVSRVPLPVLAPPLAGGPWIAVYDPFLDRGHRRVFYALDGRSRIPGRFAIDWVRVDDAGRRSISGGDRPEDYLGYGDPVLAIADGRVALVRNDVPDPASVAARPRVEIGDASGNFVALDLGAGRFAFYEHLQQGIGVRTGQHVRNGQAIAKLGFTGQTTTPHLHFHLADALSPLGAEGLAYRLSGTKAIGRYGSIDEAMRDKPWPCLENEPTDLPGPNWVLDFDRESASSAPARCT
jgi:hypothetical protein